MAQRRDLHHLMRLSAQLATARARRWREDFQAFYDQHPSYAPEYLRRWCYGVKRSRLQPIKDFVTLVENHWEGIIAWHRNHLSNGLLEGINFLVQAAKARARGHRSKAKMIIIVYLTAAKLPLPTLTKALSRITNPGHASLGDELAPAPSSPGGVVPSPGNGPVLTGVETAAPNRGNGQRFGA